MNEFQPRPLEEQITLLELVDRVLNKGVVLTGDLTLSIFFEIGTDPSLAQVDVQNRVNIALPQLPESVQAQGVSVQKKSSAFMMIISIYSPDSRYDPVYVSNYASIYVLDALKRSGKDLTRASLQRSLTALGRYDAGGYVVDFKPDFHHGGSYVDMALLKPNGEVRN